MYVIISKINPASMNIYKELKKLKPETKFFFSDKEILYIDANHLDTDYLVYASTHKSTESRKTLCVHVTGNWNKAEYGGKAKKLSMASSHLLKTFFLELNKQSQEANLQEYEITLEATHHGPYINKPHLFIEIGSSEKEWQDMNAVKVIAKTINEASKKFELHKKETKQEQKKGKKQKWQTALAFGGGHYCQSFNKHMLEDKYAFAHICPKYALASLTQDMIKQAIEKTQEKVNLALIDWKGLAGNKEKLLKILDDIGLFWEKA